MKIDVFLVLAIDKKCLGAVLNSLKHYPTHPRNQMPKLIRTIDEYFKVEKKDLYLIKFTQYQKKGAFDFKQMTSPPQGKKELLEWFKLNLPNTRIEDIFQYPESTGIEHAPWDHTICIHFDEISLKVFCEKWEDEDGKSLSPDFQCYFYQVNRYTERQSKLKDDREPKN